MSADRRARLNGVDVVYREIGEGPLVICLHGFPDSPDTWADAARQIASDGYRVVSPFLRGYGPAGSASDGCYMAWAGAEDIAALIGHLGEKQARLIGHDCGASVAHAVAAVHPELVSQLVTMSVPHGRALFSALVSDQAQQRRSWYVFFFLSPLAELGLQHDDYALIERLWKDWSPGHAVPMDHVRSVKAMFSEGETLKNALSFYRQTHLPSHTQTGWAAAADRARAMISVPTLYLHGANDNCIGATVSEGVDQMFTGPFRRVLVPKAGHFPHLENPQFFVEEVRRFFASA
ncbi:MULTISPECIES: alpha/beta fold hydrolase [Variovorax]|jgi:pimeloyl-ACP methyl ester carboxylesterase|uniref:alpha/beta fold hydrolase n=1 Tax=Variovorax TaxID=34072 RepID=UPI00086D790D|nr:MULTISPECIES: alpha/beta hydrolase [Variovorax]ODS94713.1 MAG: hypothetical protein ABS56_17455 [Lautropia sp. SCN 69-89]MBN8751800.1 alpha/beta hydrolase [Variovorax sp.]ODV15388.1 MAG: hypothetical protein ABT25_32635 [Variovorax sp. SCN 67-20]OJZ12724.1 MAG: hypothetical protein BGP22_22440 [Variovorax sp. 67-131]UKI07782.1 alpha/beta hydrolase [Variovorax paradoxus]